MKKNYSAGYVEKHNGHWRAVLSWQGEDGKQRKRTKGTGIKCHPDKVDAKTGKKVSDNRGKATAETFLRGWRDELVAAEAEKESANERNSNSTFAEYAKGYIEHKELSGTIRSVTAKGYRSHLKKIIGTELGETPISSLSPKTIIEWERAMLSDGLSPATVSHIHVFSKQVLTHARRMGDLSSNPFDLVDAPKRKAKPINSLTPFEVSKMNAALEGFSSSPLAVGSKLALLTGMRQSEICCLRWRDIDWEERLIRLTHSLTRSSGRYVIDRPKTESSIRNIPFGTALHGILTARKRAAKEERAEFGLPWDDSLFVIGSPISGKPYSPQVLGHEWHAFARAAGLVGTQGEIPRFHDLRHTFATLAISSSNGNIDVKTVSAILGHSSAAMTLNVYADALEDSKKSGMEIMDKILSQ